MFCKTCCCSALLDGPALHNDVLGDFPCDGPQRLAILHRAPRLGPVIVSPLGILRAPHLPDNALFDVERDRLQNIAVGPDWLPNLDLCILDGHCASGFGGN